MKIFLSKGKRECFLPKQHNRNFLMALPLDVFKLTVSFYTLNNLHLHILTQAWLLQCENLS